MDNLRVELTHHEPTIKKIMTNEVGFFACMPDEDIEMYKQGLWKVNFSDNWNYLKLLKDEKVIGICRFQPMTLVTVDYHSHLLPQYWGVKRGISDAFIPLIDDWFREHTKFHKIICQVPSPCKHVLKFLARNGFECEGILIGAILWRSKIEDLALLSRFIRRI